jgi:LPXTG-site transpeptidase (sortase) family protein
MAPISEPDALPAAAGTTRTALSLTSAGYAVTSIGLVLALFALYLFGFSGLQAARDQHKLLNQVTSGPAGLAALSGTAPGDGQPAAVLTIPALDVSQVAVEGTSAADLQSGPGLMPGTAPVGTLGDTVVAGRRTAFGGPFGSLSKLQAGDRITVVSALGTFHYRVTGKTLIQNTKDMAVGAQTSAARLALVTSASTFGGGGFLVVHATLVGTAVTAPSPSLPLPTASELSLAGDPSAEVPSLLWGEALILGIILTIVAYRRSRLPIITYFLSTPLLVVVALFCFESVSRLLPATI